MPALTTTTLGMTASTIVLLTLGLICVDMCVSSVLYGMESGTACTTSWYSYSLSMVMEKVLRTVHARIQVVHRAWYVATWAGTSTVPTPVFLVAPPKMRFGP